MGCCMLKDCELLYIGNNLAGQCALAQYGALVNVASSSLATGEWVVRFCAVNMANEFSSSSLSESKESILDSSSARLD